MNRMPLRDIERRDHERGEGLGRGIDLEMEWRKAKRGSAVVMHKSEPNAQNA